MPPVQVETAVVGGLNPQLPTSPPSNIASGDEDDEGGDADEQHLSIIR